MKRALAALILFLLSIAWTLTRLLAVAWAVEFLAEYFCKRRGQA